MSGPVFSRPMEETGAENGGAREMHPLLEAITEQDWDAVWAELQRVKAVDGALGQVRDANGWGPLHWACDRGDAEIVRALLQAGVDINATDASGESPLHVAVASEDAAIVELLCAAGASVSLSSLEGETPLESAADSPELLELLQRFSTTSAPTNSSSLGHA